MAAAALAADQMLLLLPAARPDAAYEPAEKNDPYELRAPLAAALRAFENAPKKLPV